MFILSSKSSNWRTKIEHNMSLTPGLLSFTAEKNLEEYVLNAIIKCYINLKKKHILHTDSCCNSNFVRASDFLTG